MTGSACHEWSLMLDPMLSCPHNVSEGNNISRFRKLTHVLWHCQYHLVWVPKYQYRVLKGPVGQELYNSTGMFCGQLGCRIEELNVQVDHVHLLVRVLPTISISKLMGVVKGRTALRIFTTFPYLRKRPY